MIIQPLRRATHIASHLLGADLAELGLSQGEVHVLADLGAAPGGATPGDLHRAFGHANSTVTGILDRLERRGLIERSPKPGDRRSQLVGLTADGRKAARAVTQALARIDAAVLARTDAADVSGFRAVLAALEEVS